MENKTYSNESAFKRVVTKKLKAIPDLYFFVKEAVGIRGIPDIIISYKGKFTAWELKKSKWELFYKRKPGMKLQGRTVLQNYTIEKIRESGGNADFIYPENFDEKLSELLRE